MKPHILCKQSLVITNIQKSNTSACSLRYCRVHFASRSTLVQLNKGPSKQRERVMPPTALFPAIF